MLVAMEGLAIVAELSQPGQKEKGEEIKMKTRRSLTIVIGTMTLGLAVFITNAQQQEKKSSPAPPMSGMSDMQDEKMNERGDHVMGFDHAKTTHHFRLLADGGSIEVGANSPQDTESRDQIRLHLGHIAKMFASGNFNAPMLIHDQIPPGVPTMQKLKSDIQYKFEEMERGARIRISARSPEAWQAIYDFLRFQIKEHKTGDSLEVVQ
jgi:hypothetical protein